MQGTPSPVFTAAAAADVSVCVWCATASEERSVTSDEEGRRTQGEREGESRHVNPMSLTSTRTPSHVLSTSSQHHTIASQSVNISIFGADTRFHTRTTSLSSSHEALASIESL